MAIEHVDIKNFSSVETPIAVDLVGSDNYQIMKMGLGADGALDLLLDSGQQTMANSLPVALASDSSVPVTNADMTACKVALELIDNAVDGNYLNVNLNYAGVDAATGNGTAAGSLRVSLASDGTGQVKLAAADGVDIGNVDVASVVPGVAATSLGKAEDAAHTSGDTGVMSLGVGKAAPSLLGADGDYVPVLMDVNGAQWVRQSDFWLVKTRISKRVAVTASATGTAIWTPTTGWRFCIVKLMVSAKASGDIQLFDGTDSGNTVVSPIVTLGSGGGFILEWPTWAPYRSAAVNNVLKFTTGTVITGSIYVEGWEENA